MYTDQMKKRARAEITAQIHMHSLALIGNYNYNKNIK